MDHFVSVVPLGEGWEAAAWPRDGNAREPAYVELFATEAEARAAADRYGAPGPT